MQKIFIVLLLQVSIFAAYNPFFQDTKASTKAFQKQVTIKVPTAVKAKVIPERKNIKCTYFGFIHSKKGKFALINFQNKNIVVRINDLLYINEQIFKIKKITSNYILLKDRYARAQTVYFSSQKQSKQRPRI